MNIAVFGRTKMLLDAAQMACQAGFSIKYVATYKETPESEATAEDFSNLASINNCRFFYGLRFDADEEEFFYNANIDVAITMNWPTMINANISQSFRYGILNAHGSDLPKYRGNACPNWAILMGDSHIAVSFHSIDPYGLDNGPIFHKEYFEITENTYIGDIYDWYKTSIPSGFLIALTKIFNGVDPSPQSGDVIRSYPRRPEDGRINWALDSSSIIRLIRASSKPFSGAFAFVNDQKVIIWRANQIALTTKILAVPGQVMWLNNNCPVIACGSGAIELIEIEVQSGNMLPKSLRSRFF